MRVSRIGLLAAVSATFSLTACKDFTSSGDVLNQAEASALAGAIVGQGFPGTGSVTAAPPVGIAATPAASSAPAAKITVNINDSGPCQGGGTIAVTGTLTADVSEANHTGTLEYKLAVAPNGCIVPGEGGKTFTLTGDPNLRGEGKLQWSATTFSGELNYSGKFNWTGSDGRSGACGVDLS